MVSNEEDKNLLKEFDMQDPVEQKEMELEGEDKDTPKTASDGAL